MKIGIFDSGLGGLSILKELLQKLPQYDYVYLADNKHVPYGSKSTDKIYEYTLKSVEFLFKQNCSLVILACNTASAVALRKIQQNDLPSFFPKKRLLGVIRPTTETILSLPLSKSIGILATSATIKSGYFIEDLNKTKKKHPPIFQQACPNLVPLIESSQFDLLKFKISLNSYLTPLKKKKVKTIILGCTHYGLLHDEVQKMVGPSILIISQGEIIAQKLKDYMQKHTEFSSKLSKNSSRLYFATQPSNLYCNKIKKYILTSIFLQEAKLI